MQSFSVKMTYACTGTFINLDYIFSSQKVFVENVIGIMNSNSFLYEMNKPIFIYDLYIIKMPHQV